MSHAAGAAWMSPSRRRFWHGGVDDPGGAPSSFEAATRSFEAASFALRLRPRCARTPPASVRGELRQADTQVVGCEAPLERGWEQRKCRVRPSRALRQRERRRSRRAPRATKGPSPRASPCDASVSPSMAADVFLRGVVAGDAVAARGATQFAAGAGPRATRLLGRRRVRCAVRKRNTSR